MATITNKYSLVEQQKRINPDGSLAKVVETLDWETGGIFSDFPWLGSNDTWTNKTVRRASLSAGTWRKLNKGISPGNSSTTEVLDVIGMLCEYLKQDKAYVDTMPNPGVYRTTEANAFMVGLMQTLVSTLIYGNANADPDKMHGIAARLNAIDGEYVFDNGGTGSDLTSIYVVTPGELESHFIYPKNAPNTGINHINKGVMTIQDSDSLDYEAYVDYFEIKCGFVVRDPRSLGRIANIETAGSSNIFNEDNLIKLINNMKISSGTRIYMNETLISQAQIMLKDKSNVNWQPADGLSGITPMTFSGIPVRKISKQLLLNTESAVA